MIIELNGLAGCGKTTIENKIKNNYEGKVKVAGVSRYRAENKNKLTRIFIMITRILILVYPSHISFSYRCFKLYFKSYSDNRFFRKSFYDDLIAVSYMVYLYKQYKSKSKKILLIDEGIIQTLSSLITVRKVKDRYIDDIIKKFLSLEKTIIFVNCNCNKKVSYNRILQRNRKVSAMDSLKGNLLLEYLKEYSLSLDIIRSKVISNKNIQVNISTELPLNEQIKIIAERIEQIQ